MRPLGLFTVLLGAALPLVDYFIGDVAPPTVGRDLQAGPALLGSSSRAMASRTPYSLALAARSVAEARREGRVRRTPWPSRRAPWRRPAARR